MNCIYCNSFIEDREDDNYNIDHSKIQCPACNEWQNVNSSIKIERVKDLDPENVIHAHCYQIIEGRVCGYSWEPELSGDEIISELRFSLTCPDCGSGEIQTKISWDAGSENISLFGGRN